MNNQHTHVGNMLFLMSLAPLSVGCVIVDGSDAESDSGGTSDPTGTAGTADGTSTTLGTEGGTEGTAVTGDESAGSETGTSGSETGGTTGEPSQICVDYGAIITECWMDDEDGAFGTMYCEQLLAEYYELGGAACQAAYEEYIVCLSSLDCVDFVGRDPQCEEEYAARNAACPDA